MPGKGSEAIDKGCIMNPHVLLQILGVSVDSPFSHLAWVQTGVAHHPVARSHMTHFVLCYHVPGNLTTPLDVELHVSSPQQSEG